MEVIKTRKKGFCVLFFLTVRGLYSVAVRLHKEVKLLPLQLLYLFIIYFFCIFCYIKLILYTIYFIL